MTRKVPDARRTPKPDKPPRPINTRQRLTKRQAARLADIMAYGPMDAAPGDEELHALGWLEKYDGTDAWDAADGAAAEFYGPDGKIRDYLSPWAPTDADRLDYVLRHGVRVTHPADGRLHLVVFTHDGLEFGQGATGRAAIDDAMLRHPEGK